jgi:hypothetical protein
LHHGGTEHTEEPRLKRKKENKIAQFIFRITEAFLI